MEIPFSKYHGTGNYFILIDNRNSFFSKAPSLIKKICHRHFGIGSDGIILVEDDDDTDFRMVFYNPDGSESFCGNGSRCVVAFASKLGIISHSGSFSACDGIHSAVMEKAGIKVSLGDAPKPRSVLNGFFIDTGSPHYVEFVNDVQTFNVTDNAMPVRFNPEFGKPGVNVNYVSEIEPGSIYVRTYERGVEKETLSCGTGVTAAAIVYGTERGFQHVEIQTRGGALGASFNDELGGEVTSIYLAGPVKHVFSGFFSNG